MTPESIVSGSVLHRPPPGSGRHAARLLPALLACAIAACSNEPSVRVIDNASDDAAAPITGPSSDGGTTTDLVEIPTVAEPELPVDLSGGGAPAPDDDLPDEPTVALPPGSQAALYLGTVGGASATVVTNDDGRLIGLVDPDAPRVLLGDGAGNVTTYRHDAGVALPIGAIWPFGGAAQPVEGALSASAGGMPAGSLDGEPVAFRANGAAFAAPSAARLAGAWVARMPLCDSDGRDCATVSLEIAFAGDAFTGRGTVTSALGDEVFASPIDGTLEPRGDLALASFLFSTYRYDGALHLLPGEVDRLLLLGTTDRVLADHPSFAAVFSRVAP